MGAHCPMLLAQFSNGGDAPEILIWLTLAIAVVLFLVIIERLNVRRRRLMKPRRPVTSTLSDQLSIPPLAVAPAARPPSPAQPAAKPPQKLDLNPGQFAAMSEKEAQKQATAAGNTLFNALFGLRDRIPPT